MVTFKNASMTTPSMGRTANGMPTFVSSGNPLVDLFSAIGSSRGKNLASQFETAYETDRVKALKILLWARDIRGGAGERQVVRDLLVHLEDTHPEDAQILIPYIPVFGRWDDLLVFRTETLRHSAYSLIAHGLTDSSTSSLVAKWLPRKGKIALELENFLGLRPTAKGFASKQIYPGKQYRRMLASLSNVVESQMCAKDWDHINFESVPSLAAARYQKAFNKHCASRYQDYRNSLTKGTAKINASAVYPYDVIKSIDNGDQIVAKAQWKALPDFLGEEQILAMVDVSGSMTARARSSNVTNLQVATSLGLYVADKAKGPFKDCFLTFSGSSKIEVLHGDIISKYRQMRSSHWAMNTNLMGAFMEILRVGKDNKVDDADMPKILLILSDMEFDSCTTGNDVRAMTSIKKMYQEAEYSLPRIVFWNLSARVGNSPVSFKEDGTALVSGFSPAIMKSILNANKMASFTPEAIMDETIGNSRYAVIE